MRRALQAVIVVVLAAAACSPPPRVATPTRSLPDPPRRTPLAPHELGTTDPRIALANLDAEIDAHARAVAEGRGGLPGGAALVELLRTRARYLGRIEDAERAAAVAADLVAAHPRAPEAVLAAADVEATLHRFARAATLLDDAARLGAEPSRLDAARAAVLQATGRYAEALALRRRLSAVRPHVLTIGAEATVLADMGRTAEAAERFVDAQATYRDVSPFPLAWLYVQEGLMWMRAGEAERARVLFAAAHARLPAYAMAAGHLGELEADAGRLEPAVALLRAAAEGSGDPDPAGHLARALDRSGDGAAAARWRARAAAGFDALMARHPEAFADHAAEFHLASGDPARGLAEARRNLAARRTPWSLALLARAGMAARDRRAACVSARGLASFALVEPVRETALEARAFCASGGAAS